MTPRIAQVCRVNLAAHFKAEWTVHYNCKHEVTRNSSLECASLSKLSTAFVQCAMHIDAFEFESANPVAR